MSANKNNITMVTVLDTSILKAFDVIYAFILVWALMFAVLQKTKIIGQAMGLNALIATAAGFIIIVSRRAVEMINFIIPWFTVAIIFLVLLLLIFQIFGLKEGDLAIAAKDKGVYWTLIGVAIIIFVAAFSSVFGQSILEAGAGARGDINATGASNNFQENITLTLFHPKVLGMIVLFGIAIMAVALLSSG